MIFVVKSYEETKDGLTAHGELTITDRNSGKTMTVNAYSGGRGRYSQDEVSLPIPIGNYEILSPTNIGYRLEALDFKPGNDIIDRTNPSQGNIRLHGPGSGLSYGCLAVKTPDEWTSVQEMFSNTQTGTSIIQRYGGLWFQKATKYGNLIVKLDSGLQREQQHQSMIYFWR